MARRPALALIPAALLALQGCPTTLSGPVTVPSPAGSPSAAPSTSPTPAAALAAPPAGPTRAVTLRGKVVVAGGASAAGAKVRVVSVTPNNPFDRTVAVADGAYELAGVPASCQYALVAIAPGHPAKVRVDTILSTAPTQLVRHFGGDAQEDLLGSNYTVGVEWCSEDPAEAAAQAWLEGRSLLDIPVHVASPIAAAAPGALSASPAAGASPSPVAAFTAAPIGGFTAKPITPCVAHIIAPLGRAGVEEVPTQGAPEVGLVGAWRVAIPGAARSTDQIVGGTVTTINVGLGAGLADLRIQADGTYAWGGTSGRMRQVMPFREGLPGVAYWLLADGGGKPHYLALAGRDALTFYLPGTNMFAASGTRLP